MFFCKYYGFAWHIDIYSQTIHKYAICTGTGFSKKYPLFGNFFQKNKK
jgi:hypothetical protein